MPSFFWLHQDTEMSARKLRLCCYVLSPVFTVGPVSRYNYPGLA